MGSMVLPLVVQLKKVEKAKVPKIQQKSRTAPLSR
jgi:hypothetical protein